jgi:hypothetical protein
MGRGTGASATKPSSVYLYSPYIHLKLFYTRTCTIIHTFVARLREDLGTNSISNGQDPSKHMCFSNANYLGFHPPQNMDVFEIWMAQIRVKQIFFSLQHHWWYMNYQEQMYASLLVNFNLCIFNLYIYIYICCSTGSTVPMEERTIHQFTWFPPACTAKGKK